MWGTQASWGADFPLAGWGMSLFCFLRLAIHVQSLSQLTCQSCSMKSLLASWRSSEQDCYKSMFKCLLEGERKLTWPVLYGNQRAAAPSFRHGDFLHNLCLGSELVSVPCCKQYTGESICCFQLHNGSVIASMCELGQRRAYLRFLCLRCATKITQLTKRVSTSCSICYTASSHGWSAALLEINIFMELGSLWTLLKANEISVPSVALYFQEASIEMNYDHCCIKQNCYTVKALGSGETATAEQPLWMSTPRSAIPWR